jgi:hypothetical protein
MIQSLTAAALAALLLPAEPCTRGDDGATAFGRDRRAILAMAGTFRVAFHFEETFACTPGYELEPAYDESAVEVVRVIEDRGGFISLQHVLVVDHDSEEPLVVKHWRQDWSYEDTELVLFRGHDVWERLAVPAPEAAGTWTQAVHQVGDSPRYEGRGRWRHRGASSTWESEETWRPLPRREKRREDYHAIAARNAHTVTPEGWAHEERNQKLVLDEDGAPLGVLAHEEGLNTYTRDPALELQIADDYWEGTAALWAEVREAWSEALSAHGRYRIEGGRTTNAFATLADEYREGAWHDDAARRERVREVIGGAVARLDPAGQRVPSAAARR